MNKTLFYIILASTFTLGACAGNTPAPETKTAAATAETSAAEPKQAAAPKRSKRICKRMAPTGSRLGKKVCGTQEQWDRAARDSAEALRGVTRKSAQGGYEE
ncbi:hypothetical protein FKG94_16460 [Exilibacterium tricleocarpae]|uniref:Lipoprotein n=1 Tax=Exilibacterium tricleocarpae TaxID=2591008 RepID=A0A545TAF9_9GAMM|nr:hypothetical protein [Exilibacterium tricleocarpae]TQV74199.1 hypothetical protein FKG94_16460 [Exilibacterium tricleocarpae]